MLPWATPLYNHNGKNIIEELLFFLIFCYYPRQWIFLVIFKIIQSMETWFCYTNIQWNCVSIAYIWNKKIQWKHNFVVYFYNVIHFHCICLIYFLCFFTQKMHNENTIVLYNSTMEKMIWMMVSHGHSDATTRGRHQKHKIYIVT